MMDVAEGEVPTAAKLRKLRVIDLRKRLQGLELPQSGNKEELIGRVRQYYLDQQAKRENEAKEAKEEGMAVEEGGTEEKGGQDESVDIKREGEGGEEEEESEGEEQKGEKGEEKKKVDGGEKERQGAVEKEEGEGGGIKEEKEDETVIKDEVEDMQTETTEPVTETAPSEQATQPAEPQQPNTTVGDGSDGVAGGETSATGTAPGTSESMEREEEGRGGKKDGEKMEGEAEIEPATTESNVDKPPPVTTSDYYSDSAREDHPQIAQHHPPTAQDHLPTVQHHPPTAQDHLPTVQPTTVPVSATPPAAKKKTKTPAAAGKKTPVAEPEKKTEEPKGKKKKKRRRRRRHNQGAESGGVAKEAENEPPEVEIEYVQEDVLKPGDTHYNQFHKIFEAFKLSDDSEATPKATPISHIPDDDSMSIAAKSSAAQKKQREEESEDEEEPQEPTKLSKKKLRKLNRLSVAQLKQLVERPDVVEMHDVTAQDPKLLIHLKSTRNTVPVPRHWCFKRKYLQGKRGIEKPPFNLPDFIKATGIMEMRQALEEKEDAKSLKQKTRERVRPKMGKLTIDYQKLHDAFFRWQTKPKMTIHGDLYYEGKEFETRLKEKKPGDLSDELRRALGMPTGMGKQKFPPPWLVAMQRYGPPPSYPNLKIPGLNAPIPEGCSFGYFVGGWGKPPVDEMGRPLYGDVFGLDNPDSHVRTNDDEIDKQLWGELESEEEMDEEEESDEDEGELKPEDLQAGLITPLEGGLVTPSGLTSIPAGLETPEMIQLRKKKIEEAMEQGGNTPALYTVLPEKSQPVGGAVMGSSHVYDLSAAVPGANKKTGGGTGGEGVEVALDPSELDLDAATMTARYEEQMKETKLQKEDLSDMVAEHAAKQKKRKRAATDSTSGKSSKKLKEFKF